MSYAISTGHKMTTAAAKEILSAGGSAVDAAIAAYWMSFLSEPCMASVGAGGFALVYHEGSMFNVNFFCQTPIQKKKEEDLDFYPVEVDFGIEKEIFYVGMGSLATPGTVSGIYEMHRRWGTMPMKELAAFTIEKAKEGIEIGPFQEQGFGLLEKILRKDKSAEPIFFKNGQLKKTRDLIAMPGYADFLDVLAREGEDLFYKGEIAQTITERCEKGGMLTRHDFEAYETLVGAPLRFSWLDKVVYTTPISSVGGAIIAALLKVFEKKSSKVIPSFLSKAHFDILRETIMEIDPIKDDISVLDQYLKVNFGINIFTDTSQGNKWGGTSHFNVVDEKGNAVALSTSIGEGCGYFIPGTDMQLNNMLGEAALMPNGFHNWTPNIRLRSMMSPTMVTDQNGKLLFVTGTGGAGRIPFVIAQTIINKICFSHDIDTAIHAPKVHYDGKTWQIETGFDIPSIENSKTWKEPSLYFGGTHAISVENGSKIAAGDHRRYGSAFSG